MVVLFLRIRAVYNYKGGGIVAPSFFVKLALYFYLGIKREGGGIRQ